VQVLLTNLIGQLGGLGGDIGGQQNDHEERKRLHLGAQVKVEEEEEDGLGVVLLPLLFFSWRVLWWVKNKKRRVCARSTSRQTRQQINQRNGDWPRDVCCAC
jgi:hypothetical protein